MSIAESVSEGTSRRRLTLVARATALCLATLGFSASVWADDAPKDASGGPAPRTPPPANAAAAQQTVSAPTTDPAALARAREYFEAGAKFYEESKFDKAIELFELAYRTAPRSGILFSLAQAQRRAFGLSGRTENLAKAIEQYEKYIQMVSEGGRRSEALRALAELRLTARGLDLSQSSSSEEKVRTAIIVNIFVDGTLVSIDGRAPQKPPIDEPVTPGRHRVKLSAPGYFDVEKVIDIEDGRIALANFEQKEQPGRLSVDAASGTEISVDGRFVSETPMSAPIELPSGPHVVSVTKLGHSSLVREIDVAPGREVPLRFEMSTTPQRDVSIVTLTSAGVIAATACVFLGISLAAEAEATSILDRRSALLESGKGSALGVSDAGAYVDARERRDLFTGLFAGTAAAAAGVSLVGLALFVFDKPRAVEAPAVKRGPVRPPKRQDLPLELSVVPGVSPAGFALDVRF